MALVSSLDKKLKRVEIAMRKDPESVLAEEEADAVHSQAKRHGGPEAHVDLDVDVVVGQDKVAKRWWPFHRGFSGAYA